MQHRVQWPTLGVIIRFASEAGNPWVAERLFVSGIGLFAWCRYVILWFRYCTSIHGVFFIPKQLLESSWNVMAHGDAREGKWRGNWRMEWVSSTLHTTSEHGVSSITTVYAHTSAANIRQNWRPRRFKWTRSFSSKDEILFLRVCHHISNAVYCSVVRRLRTYDTRAQSGTWNELLRSWVRCDSKYRHWLTKDDDTKKEITKERNEFPWQ